MLGWDEWKKSFDVWENATARYLEQWLKSPLLLGPAGTMMTAAMKAKATADDVKAKVASGLGLPTRRDQERTLHLLNQLQSRLIDLEEKLEDLEADKSRGDRSWT